MTIPDPATLRAVLTETNVPRALRRLIEDAEDVSGAIEPFSWKEVFVGLQQEPAPSGSLHHELRSRLAAWDHADPDAAWTQRTARYSDERRQLILKRLDVPSDLRDYLAQYLPPSRPEDPIVVAVSHDDWYPSANNTQVHWDSYKTYLRDGGWPSASIASLDQTTDEILSRLADPRATPEKRTGLVVGYVQSGKTANITGLIAKAVDEGYRLIIVMSGTTNLLRAQTQRRIDKELVGKRALMPDHSYKDDPDWADFNDLRPDPEASGTPKWLRFTNYRDDFKPQSYAALSGLADPTSISLLVIKKNTAPLRRVVKAVDDTSAKNVPTLIIDDESDHASIDTSRGSKRRTAINRRIVELKQKLDRAQYIGYTATPFANVFIDPDNAEDLFPRDFIISLPRPEGYVGAAAFHDLEGVPEGLDEDPAVSNERAFVRAVTDSDDEESLAEAIDSFVLSGALKCFRHTQGYGSFRHHTMLVHTSHLTAEHKTVADRVRSLYEFADYRGGIQRLWDLYTRDHGPVTAARDPEAPRPQSKAQLTSAVGRCLDLIHRSGANPVLIVNASDLGTEPDFSMQPTWRILVGGAKLSRGYTVEGLTVSYFTKTPGAQDTLMQMGRWFGFRQYYADLVRLYVSRSETRSGSGYDTLLAFEAACRDEEAFRAELARYAEDDPPIKPFQVPPLVTSHLPTLSPTAPNKMFNAKLRVKNLGETWSMPTWLPEPSDFEKLRANLNAINRLLPSELKEGSFQMKSSARSEVTSVSAFWGSTSLESLLRLLKDFQWTQDKTPVYWEQQYLEGGTDVDPRIEDVLVLLPLTKGRTNTTPIGNIHLPVRARARSATGRVKVLGEPHHRDVAEYIAEKLPANASKNKLLRRLRKSGRAVILVYATGANRDEVAEVASDLRPPAVGFELFFPANGQPHHAVFEVLRSDSSPVVST